MATARPAVHRHDHRRHDYKRHGTTTLFAALYIPNGKGIGACLPRHRSREFLRFLRPLEAKMPADMQIHLIVDNASTHKSAEVRRWLTPKKRGRFHFHFTPTSSSWLHQVERLFGIITDRMIRRGTFHSVAELETVRSTNGSPSGTRLPGHSPGRPPQTSQSNRCAVVKNQLGRHTSQGMRRAPRNYWRIPQDNAASSNTYCAGYR